MSGLRERLAEAIYKEQPVANWTEGHSGEPIEWGKVFSDHIRDRCLRQSDAALSAFRQWLEDKGLKIVPRQATVDQMPEVKLPMDVELFCQTMQTCADLYGVMVAMAPDPLGDGP